MKSVFLSLICTFALSANAAPIIDFSEDHQSDFGDSLYFEQENILLNQLFEKFSRDSNNCQEGAELVEDGIKAVRGSFTAPGQNEMLIAFMSSACPGTHVGQHGNLALFRDMKFVDGSRELASYQFEKVWDLDGDGASEVIVSAFNGNQGYFQTEAMTLTFKGGTIKQVDYVAGIVHKEDCGVKGDGSGTDIDAVFFPDRNRPGKLLQKNYSKKCSADSKGYKFYSDGPLSSF